MADPSTQDSSAQALQQEKMAEDLRKKDLERKKEATDKRDPSDWALL